MEKRCKFMGLNSSIIKDRVTQQATLDGVVKNSPATRLWHVAGGTAYHLHAAAHAMTPWFAGKIRYPPIGVSRGKITASLEHWTKF